MSDLKKVISIELDDKTKSGMSNINKTIDAAGKSIENANKQSISLRRELKQLQNDLLSGKFTGEEFERATERAGELKDTIGDLNSRIRTLGSDTRTLDGLINAAEGIAGGFALAQGAAALLGTENEDLNRALLKVQASMAILQGLQSVANVLQKESAARILATTAAQKLYTFVTEGATLATKALRVALISTGIGALVVGVMALVSAWNEYSDSVEEAKKEQDKLNESLEYNKTLTDDEVKNIDHKTKIALLSAKARGASEKELNDILLAGIKSRIAALDLEEKKMNAIPRNKWSDEMKKRSIEITREQLALLREQDLLITEFAANMIIGIKEANKKSLEETHQLYLKGVDDYLRTTKDGFDKQHYLINNDNNLTLKEKKAFNKKIAEAEAAQKKAIADKQLADDMASAQQAIDILNGLRDDAETPAERELREYNEKKAVLEANNLSIEELTRQHIKKMKKIQADGEEEDKAKQQEELDRQQIVTNAKIGLRNAELDATIAAFNIAAGFAKKGSDLQKTLIIAEKSATIAKIIMNTMSANAADKAYAATMGPYGVAYLAAKIPTNYTQMGIGIATTIAAAAQALSSMGGGSAGGGGSTGGGAAAPPAQFNIVGQSSTNQLAGTIAGQQNQPVKAYVVGSDVTTQQSLDRNKINNSTFLSFIPFIFMMVGCCI